MSEDFDFDAALKELDKSETHLVVRVEFRRWGKPMTIIQGLPETGRSLDEVAHRLKGRLATGGTAKTIEPESRTSWSRWDSEKTT